MALKKLKKIKYKTTGCFGDLDEGTVIDAFVVLQEKDASALLYHPPGSSGGGTASIEMAHKVDGFYQSSNEDDGFGWVNLKPIDLEALIANLQWIQAYGESDADS